MLRLLDTSRRIVTSAQGYYPGDAARAKPWDRRRTSRMVQWGTIRGDYERLTFPSRKGKRDVAGCQGHPYDMEREMLQKPQLISTHDII